MRILIGTPFMAPHFDAGYFWTRALVNIGYSVYPWDYRMQPEMPKVDADACIVFKGESIDPSILPRPCVNYWPDAFERTPGIEKILAQYDLVFTSIRPTPKEMTWLPSGFDPLVHKDLGIERIVDTLYIGTCNSNYKYDMIAAIKPQVICGNNWPPPINALPARYLHDFVYTANQAKILVDVHQTPTINGHRKAFEYIMAGFTIIDWVHGIEEIFPDIWDKFTFRTAEEARNLIRYYLSHEAERNELWQKQKKAIEPYSYENCCRRILECVSAL